MQGEDTNDSLKYIAERLVSGLGSNRECARQGFFSTLSYFLKIYPDKGPQIYDIIGNKLNGNQLSREVSYSMLFDLYIW